MVASPRSVGLAVAAVLGVIVAVAGCRKGASRTGVACFDTPEWGQAGGLELRADPSGAGLLLRYRTTVERLREDVPGGPASGDAPLPAIRRFDPESARLEGADGHLWREATTEVVDCDLQAAAPTAPFVLDGRERVLRWRDRAVRAAGRNVLMLVAAPDGHRVAVLSAAGSAAEAVLPFLGRGGASGQHYHQVFQRADGTEQGEGVALPLTSRDVALSGCWSADGRSMVYADVLHNHLCIVQPRAEEGDRR